MARTTARLLVQVSGFALIFLAGVPAVLAANLYLDPQEGAYRRGDTFTVKVRLDATPDCINAVDVRLGYPADTLKIVDVGTGSSILTLWTEKPKIDAEKGTLVFSGGLPGSYCGRTEGDPGLTNILAEVVFQTAGMTVGKKPATVGRIEFLPGSAVLRADGTGVPVTLSLSGSAFTLSENGAIVADSWSERVREDKVPPQLFSIELSKSSSVFSGAYFIVFSTTDKETGIDYYEVQESDVNGSGLRVGSNRKAAWRRADSPYKLEDQSLNSIVRVRAMDKAGNQRLAGFIPDESQRHFRMSTGYWIAGASATALFIVLLFVVLMVRRRRKGAGEISDGGTVPPGGAVSPPQQ